jgi:ADP-ribosyl-[dinitrogen reductase] hydrolase
VSLFTRAICAFSTGWIEETVTAFGRDSIVGSIVGGAVGDVLGGVSERGSLSLSDDTQLTLATCEAVIRSGAALPEEIAAAMLAWFLAGRIRGIGSSTLKAMRDLAAGTHWALSGARGERAAGNGAAMRIAPVAFLLDPVAPADRTRIRDIARITHHHDEAYIGALAVVVAIRAAAGGTVPEPAAVIAALPDSRVRDNLERIVGSAPGSLRAVAREIGTSGFVAETVPVAIAAAARMAREGFEAVLYELNEIGGDTDTIGSIAGQIAGAAVGASNVPAHLLANVAESQCVFDIAEQLPTAVQAG